MPMDRAPRGPGRLIPVPNGSGVRWVAVLDARTATAYRASVTRLAPRIEARLGPAVIANRVRSVGGRSSGDALWLEPWRAARRRLVREARKRASAHGVLLITDVRDCYPSIGGSLVGERLLELGCHPTEIGALVRLLQEFRERGFRGLPVGPDPSAVLANAVLEAGDRAVASEGGDHLRWVDDFLVFARDADHAAAILHQLRATLSGMGLALSEAKTRLIEDPEHVRAASLGTSDAWPRL